MWRSWLLLVCILFPFVSSGSRTSDSLSVLIRAEKNNDRQLHLLVALCDLHRTYPVDSLHAYAQKAIEVAEKANDPRIDLFRYYLALYYYKTSKLDSVKQIILPLKRRLSSARTINDRQLLNRVTLLLGGVNIKENTQREAMSAYYEVLPRAAEIKDSASYLIAINGVGWANMELGRCNEAIKWFHKGIAISTSDGYERFKTNMYANIASCYGDIGKVNIAKHYAVEALRISEKHEDLFCIANGLNILGNIYILEKNINKAIECLARATEVRKASGDPFFIVSDMSQLALLYAGNREFEKGIRLSREAIEIAEKRNIDAKLPFLYNSLAQVYFQKEDFKNAYLTLVKLNNIKDKRYENASAEKIAELQVKYETSVKENTIQKQRFELSKKSYMLYSSIGLLLLVAGIGFIGYKNFTQQQALRLQTALAKQQEENARAILEVEEKERSRFAAELHDGLGPLLSAVKYNLSGLSHKLDSLSNEEKLVFQKTMNMLDESCKEVRQVSHNIMPHSLLKKGLGNAIREFISKIDNKNLQVHLYLSGLDNSIDPKVEIAAYRIIQESINNVIKHADATKLDITLSRDDEGLSGAVEDNGKGFDVNKAGNIEGGIGLRNMLSRVQFLHGHLEIDSRPGNGTLIAFHIP